MASRCRRQKTARQMQMFVCYGNGELIVAGLDSALLQEECTTHNHRRLAGRLQRCVRSKFQEVEEAQEEDNAAVTLMEAAGFHRTKVRAGGRTTPEMYVDSSQKPLLDDVMDGLMRACDPTRVADLSHAREARRHIHGLSRAGGAAVAASPAAPRDWTSKCT